MRDFENTIEGLTRIVGRGYIKTGPEAITEYAVDNTMPKAVVYPADTQQIAEVVRFANGENLAILPWGSGARMATGNPPRRLDVVVSTSRLDTITDIDISNLTVTVEAGVKLKDIQLTLTSREGRSYIPTDHRAHDTVGPMYSEGGNKGCFLPIDPPLIDRTTIGGAIATNSSGPRRLLYGLPRDIVLGVQFVTPGGEIVKAGGKTVKNVSGYDISKLMIGSYGSLGILCEITLRLLPLPERMETLLFPFASFSDVSLFAEGILESNLLPGAVEVLNRETYKNLGLMGPPGRESGYIVAVALEGFEEPVTRMGTETKETAKGLGTKGEGQLKEDEHGAFWVTLSNIESSLAEEFPALTTLQLNYPISNWREISQFVERALSKNSIEYSMLIHAGSGVCLSNLHLEKNDEVGIDRAIQTIAKIFQHCTRKGGNLIIKRAPAHLKERLSIWGKASADLPVMRRIKEQLDPHQVMCPGRFVV